VQTCGEILSARIYYDEMEDWYRLLLDLIPFKLAAILLQPRVVGPYLVRGVWFSSHFPLKATGRIQIYGH
jgi:hypothetical protein